MKSSFIVQVVGRGRERAVTLIEITFVICYTCMLLYVLVFTVASVPVKENACSTQLIQYNKVKKFSSV